MKSQYFIILRQLYEKTDGKPFEPKDVWHPFFGAMVKAGLMRRLDGRCGFEAFKNSHVGFTGKGKVFCSAETAVLEALE